MKTLEKELEVPNDTGLLNIDTNVKSEFTNSPQISPYYKTGNPLVSQHTDRTKIPITSNSNNTTPQRIYAREEMYHGSKRQDLPDVTQHGQNKQAGQPSVVLQQLVQSPLYVNLAPGSLHRLPDGRTSLVQLDNVTSVNTSVTNHNTNTPLLIQNNTKGITPLILKGADNNFSPVILQSNIINPDTQTVMYTSVQGKYIICHILKF